MMEKKWVTVLGSFVADLAFRTNRIPVWGETLMGNEFKLGPGGKGSNQAVAAARAGGRVSFISKLGPDPFGDMARALYKSEGIDTQFLFTTQSATGAAAIIIDAHKGENAIIVVPGACFEVTAEEVDQARALIAGSAIFVAQLELPLPVVEHGLTLAHSLGVPTILNPRPLRRCQRASTGTSTTSRPMSRRPPRSPAFRSRPSPTPRRPPMRSLPAACRTPSSPWARRESS